MKNLLLVLSLMFVGCSPCVNPMGDAGIESGVESDAGYPRCIVDGIDTPRDECAACEEALYAAISQCELHYPRCTGCWPYSDPSCSDCNPDYDIGYHACVDSYLETHWCYS